MNDEPHSHKKATVVLVTILLLAYVGSYLGMRQNSSVKHSNLPEYIVLDRANGYFPPDSFLDIFYWPLRFLDYKTTGKHYFFYVLPDAE